MLTNLTGIMAISAGGLHSCALRADGQPFCWGENTDGQVGDGSAPTDHDIARAVPSFSFNIDPNSVLLGQGHVAQLTALVNCPAREQVQIEATVTQGQTQAKGTQLAYVRARWRDMT